MTKHIFFLFSLICGLSTLQAQIIIEETDYAELNVEYSVILDSIGDDDTQVLFSSLGAAPWDFSYLGNDGTGITEYVSPSATAYPTEFPAANMVMDYEGIGLGYINKSATQVKLEGIAIDNSAFAGMLTQPLVFNLDSADGDDIILMEFPMQMGSQLSSTKTYQDEGYGDSLLASYGISTAIIPPDYVNILATTYLYITIDITVASEVEAFGNLQIPNATFETLRQVSNTSINFSVDAWAIFTTVPVFDTALTTTSYNWYANDEGIPVLTAQLDNYGNVNNFSYKDVLYSEINEQELAANDIEAYPNPTNGQLNFNFADNTKRQVRISDITGKLLLEQDCTQTNLSLDISGFNQGVYLISIQTGNEIYSSKIVKQ